MLELTLGQAQRLDGLTLFPILSRGPARLPYELLADALAQGRARVTEVGSGSVPTLAVENTLEVPILVLDGEQLIGARQNRTTNRSIILASGVATEIPVSCMEQGRWRFVSPEFRASEDHSPTKVRRKARELEHDLVRQRVRATVGALSSAQGQVWSEIAELSENLGVKSSTGALDDAYAAIRPDFEGWAGSFPRIEGQVGLMALTAGGTIGADIVGCHRLYGRVHSRLVRGYLMDALDLGALARKRRGPGGPEAPGDVHPEEDGSFADTVSAVEGHARDFMEAVKRADRTPAPSVGMGRYHVLSRDVVGGELTHADRLAHLSAFPRHRHRSHPPRPRRPWTF